MSERVDEERVVPVDFEARPFVDMGKVDASSFEHVEYVDQRTRPIVCREHQ